MPFIHIKSLPIRDMQVGDIVRGVSIDFASSLDIALKHVTVTWDFLPSGHYAVAGKVADYQPDESHPVLVDILAPDINDAETIKHMMLTVSESIARRVQVPRRNIFINYRAAHSGMVFDNGEVVEW